MLPRDERIHSALVARAHARRAITSLARVRRLEPVRDDGWLLGKGTPYGHHARRREACRARWVGGIRTGAHNKDMMGSACE